MLIDPVRVSDFLLFALGIMFKKAVDVELIPGLFLYGGKSRDDNLAAKGASNELKAASQYSSFFFNNKVPVSVPMQVLIGEIRCYARRINSLCLSA